MILNKHKLAFIGFVLASDQSYKSDTQRYHEELKLENKDYVLGPIGMFLEEYLSNPNSKASSLLKQRAIDSLMKF